MKSHQHRKYKIAIFIADCVRKLRGIRDLLPGSHKHGEKTEAKPKGARKGVQDPHLPHGL